MQDTNSGPDITSIKSKLLKRIDFDASFVNSKVTIVGCTEVGMSCAFCLLMDDVVKRIAFIDSDDKRIKSEASDLQHAAYFTKSAKIEGGSDYALSADSDICIIAAQAIIPPEEQSEINVPQENVKLYMDIIPNIIKYSPYAILLIATEPCNIMSYVAWRLSRFPKNRVLGLGTHEESCKLRYHISKKIGAAPHSSRGWILGDTYEAGGFTDWNSVGIAGVRFVDFTPKIGTDDDKEKWNLLPAKIQVNNREVKKIGNGPKWGIGFSCARLVRVILKDALDIHPVACYAEGVFGIKHQVFMSLPCVLGLNGVVSIMQQKLSDSEKKKLRKIADKNHNVQINLILVNNP